MLQENNTEGGLNAFFCLFILWKERYLDPAWNHLREVAEVLPTSLLLATDATLVTVHDDVSQSESHCRFTWSWS